VAESKQYLRIGLRGQEFLLPSEASVSIEQRENLTLEREDPRVTAWRVSRGERWPAFQLDHRLSPVRNNDWQRAVFVDAHPHPVGLIAAEIQLLPHAIVDVEPFTPLGPPPTLRGHLFSGAWVRGNQLMLVFSPQSLVAYLLQVGAPA
jgi:hypothetical protein